MCAKEFGSDSGWALDVQYIHLPLQISALMREGLCVCMCTQGCSSFLKLSSETRRHKNTHTHTHTHTPQLDRIKEVTSCKLFSAHPSFYRNSNHRSRLSLFLSRQSLSEEDPVQKHEVFTSGICDSHIQWMQTSALER